MPNNNLNNLEKARQAAVKTMNEQKAVRDAFREKNADCIKKMEDAENALKKINKEIINTDAENTIARQEKLEYYRSIDDEMTRELRRPPCFSKAYVDGQKKMLDNLKKDYDKAGWFDPPDKDDVKKAEREYNRLHNMWNERVDKYNKFVKEYNDAYYNRPTEDALKNAQALMKEREKLQKNLANIEQECKKIFDEYNNLPKDYDDNIEEKLKEVPEGRAGVSSIAALRKGRKLSVSGKGETFADDELIDLRNVNRKKL